MPEGQPDQVPADGLSTRQRRNRPLLVVHTGDGKGKSTAAFGLALRGWNQGWSIGVFQFVKSARWRIGEQAALETLAELHGQTGRGGPIEWHKMGSGWSWSRKPGTEDDHAPRRGGCQDQAKAGRRDARCSTGRSPIRSLGMGGVDACADDGERRFAARISPGGPDPKVVEIACWSPDDQDQAPFEDPEGQAGSMGTCRESCRRSRSGPASTSPPGYGSPGIEGCSRRFKVSRRIDPATALATGPPVDLDPHRAGRPYGQAAARRKHRSR